MLNADASIYRPQNTIDPDTGRLYPTLESAIEGGVRTGVTGMVPQLPTDRTAFRTSFLVYETVRDPFNNGIYLGLTKAARRRLNILAAIGQFLILVLPTMVHMVTSDANTESCTYRQNEMETATVYDYKGGAKIRMYTYIKNKDISSFPRPDKARTEATCALLLDASLERRESMIRDYMGPFATRKIDTSKRKRCGYFSKPDDLGGVGSNHKWTMAYFALEKLGFHYGSPPVIEKQRPEGSAKDGYIYVCVMEPIIVQIFGTDYFVEYLSMIGIAVFFLVSLFGPDLYHDKCFTIAIIGMVMLSGMAVAMAAVFVTALYIATLKWVVRLVFKERLAAYDSQCRERMGAEDAKNLV